MRKPMQLLEKTLLFIFLVLTALPGLSQAEVSWSMPVIISGPPVGSGINPSVAIDGRGNALAVWATSTLDEIWASYLPAGLTTWSTPVRISGTLSLSLSTGPALDFNSSGQAIAVWQTAADGIVRANAFSVGVWRMPVAISPAGDASFSPIRVAIDNTGQAIAVWTRPAGTNRIEASSLAVFHELWAAPVFLSDDGQNADDANVDINNGTGIVTWSNESPNTIRAVRINPVGPVIGSTLDLLTTSESADFSKVKVDSIGNAIVIWLNNSLGFIQAATISSADVVSSPEAISTPDSLDSSLGMDGEGNALAAWMDFDGTNYNIYSKILPFGGSWPADPAPVFATSNFLSGIVAAENEVGDAVLIWTNFNAFSIQASTLAHGGIWAPKIDISSLAASVNPDVAIAPATYGRVVAVWQNLEANGRQANASIRSELFPPVIIPPTPPLQLTGAVVKNKFLSQTEYIHRLNWLPSSDPTVIGYHVYRNGILVAVVPANGPFFFVDHNRYPHIADVYQVTAFNSSGDSTPLVIRIK